MVAFELTGRLGDGLPLAPRVQLGHVVGCLWRPRSGRAFSFRYRCYVCSAPTLGRMEPGLQAPPTPGYRRRRWTPLWSSRRCIFK